MIEGRRNKATLQREVRRHVKPTATVITDELGSYRGLDAHYEHLVVNHAENYVVGRVHTNGIENFWSLVKRSLGGTYVSVRPFHLFRYLDESTYRYNKREWSPAERVSGVLGGIEGKRLTFKELTGKIKKPEPPKPAFPWKPRNFPMGPF